MTQKGKWKSTITTGIKNITS